MPSLSEAPAVAARHAPPLGPGEYDEILAEEVERRDLLAAALEPDVRRTRAGPAAQLVGMLNERIVGGRFGDDGRRAIAVADLDQQVVHERLDVLRAALRHDARCVARIGLVDP